MTIILFGNVNFCKYYVNFVTEWSRFYIGLLCLFIAPGKSPNPERDRTLTIIGIVIGILIFVCFCIASYFLAK